MNRQTEKQYSEGLHTLPHPPYKGTSYRAAIKCQTKDLTLLQHAMPAP